MKKIFKDLLFVIIALVIFFYTFIQSDYSLTNEYYFTYYIISLFFLILGIIFIFFSAETKIKITITFLSILFSLYLIEGFITYNYYSKFINKVKQYDSYDKRSPFDAYEYYKKKYNNLRFRISPAQFWNNNNLNLLPLSTISNSLIFNCNENGYYSMWYSDLYGFNNPNEAWDEIDDEKILLLGDSFATGECVNEKDNIAGNLRLKFNKKVINLGVGGNGPLSNYAILREYFDKSKSKNVFWLHYEGNDIYELQRELNNKILKNYYLDENFSQNISSKQSQIDKFLINFLSNFEQEIDKQPFHAEFDWIRFLKLYSLRELTIHSIFNKPPEVTKEYFEIILKSKQFVEKNNSKFYFVYLPQFHRYSSYYGFSNKKNYELIINFLNSNNIKYLDIHTEVFKKAKNPLDLFPFQSAGHYNDKGYNFIAKVIADFVN